MNVITLHVTNVKTLDNIEYFMNFPPVFATKLYRGSGFPQKSAKRGATMKTLLISMVLACSLFSAQKFIEPPISFSDTPLNVAVETVFLAAGAQYCIEIPLSPYGNVNLNIKRKMELDSLLSLLLDPKGLTFTKISNIYIIKKKQNADPVRVTKFYSPNSAPLESSEIEYIYPPLEFKNTPVKTALETLFIKVGTNIKFYGDPDEKITYTLKEKMPVKVLLLILLKDTNVKIENKSGVMYLSQNEKK